MSQSLSHAMTPDEFLDWDLLQPDCRHELVDGLPVAMTGARQVHDVILGNIFANLWIQLDGKPCRVATPDIALRMANRNVRRPDVTVYCPPFDANALFAASPTLVVEVLSASTRPSYLARKLSEYYEVPSIRYVLLVEPTQPQVTFWWRTVGFWDSKVFDTLNGVIETSEPDLCLGLALIYKDVIFPPRLVS